MNSGESLTILSPPEFLVDCSESTTNGGQPLSTFTGQSKVWIIFISEELSLSDPPPPPCISRGGGVSDRKSDSADALGLGWGSQMLMQYLNTSV